MSDKDEISKAAKAQALLNDATLSEAFSNLRIALLQKIELAPLRDEEGVHEARLMLKLLRDLKGNLVLFVNAGKMAEVKIEQEKKYQRLKRPR